MTAAIRSRFWWLPNTITAMRLILGVPIMLAALHDAWALAFWLFVAALLTDFLDGLAAKKLKAFSKFGEELDPLADAGLVVAGFLALSTTGHVEWWITIGVFVVGGSLGLERFFVHRPVWAMVVCKVLSVGGLFIEWTVIAWLLATQAFGWTWLYVPGALVILAMCASLKRHRIHAWLHPVATPPPPAKRSRRDVS